jgi:hypothetical protein
LVIAVVVGLLAGPALAVGAAKIFGRPESAKTEGSVPTSTAAAATATPVVQAAATTTTTAGPSDMELACGPEGQTLVAREENGTITGLEQAALDALRPICTEAGMPLTGSGASAGSSVSPDTTTSTTAPPPAVTVPAPRPQPNSGGGGRYSDDEYEGGDD